MNSSADTNGCGSSNSSSSNDEERDLVSPESLHLSSGEIGPDDALESYSPREPNTQIILQLGQHINSEYHTETFDLFPQEVLNIPSVTRQDEEPLRRTQQQYARILVGNLRSVLQRNRNLGISDWSFLQEELQNCLHLVTGPGDESIFQQTSSDSATVLPNQDENYQLGERQVNQEIMQEDMEYGNAQEEKFEEANSKEKEIGDEEYIIAAIMRVATISAKLVLKTRNIFLNLAKC